MELKGDVHGLAEKAWALHEMISEEIDRTSYSLCRLCSENGLYCGIAETPFREREGLVAIRDSLKEVRDLLLILQRLRDSQPKDRIDALARLEESRSELAKEVAQYQGRPLDVVRELNTCFNNKITAFDWNPTTQKVNSNANQVGKKPEPRFWILCLKLLFDPWRWKRAVGVAAKLAVIFASVSSAVSICSAKNMRFKGSSRKAVVGSGSGSRGVVWLAQDSSFGVLHELKGDVHGLVEKAWALHEMISEEINRTSCGLGRLCSENGLYCGIAETPFREREGLTAIRDSLKEVRDSLLILQRLGGSHSKDRVDAHERLEESRSELAKEVAQYQGRPHDVVGELNTCFNDKITASDWNPTTKKVHPNGNQVVKKPEPRFWILCLKLLFDPGRWKRAAVIAAKLAVICASVLPAVSTCKCNHKNMVLLEDKNPQQRFGCVAKDSSLSVVLGRHSW